MVASRNNLRFLYLFVVPGYAGARRCVQLFFSTCGVIVGFGETRVVFLLRQRLADVSR